MAALSAFNLHRQKGENWLNRAEVAADLIRRHSPPNPLIADLGCGDLKLMRALNGFPCEYRGYDLHPQSDAIKLLDISAEPLPEADVTVLLGVLEYIPIAPVLAKVRSPLLVVSHLYPDEGAFTPKMIRENGWSNVLPKAEFEALLAGAGFRIAKAVQTPEQMQYVWLTERST